MALPANIREDFPFLTQQDASHKPWIYLDSAATTLKPRPVIEEVTRALSYHSTNIHRSVHGSGDQTTELFEGARRRIARFLGAQPHEVVFVRNTTEALNLVAHSYPVSGATLISLGEHHSNILPWRQRGEVRSLAPRSDGGINMDLMKEELKKGGIDVVSVSHVSNVTGLLTEIRPLADLVHQYGALLVVDAAQSAGRIPIDVTEFDCDFLACSGHKMYGPSGIGILYGKAERLHQLQPYQFGGGTVESVSGSSCIWRSVPWRFEAGTPAIESVLGLGRAVEYLQELGMEEVGDHEQELTAVAIDNLTSVPNCQIVAGENKNARWGVISFYFSRESSHVIARTLSDRYRICLRSGHHCAQPLHDSTGVPPTLRLSFGVYSNAEEIRYAIQSLQDCLKHLPGR